MRPTVHAQARKYSGKEAYLNRRYRFKHATNNRLDLAKKCPRAGGVEQSGPRLSNIGRCNGGRTPLKKILDERRNGDLYITTQKKHNTPPVVPSRIFRSAILLLHYSIDYVICTSTALVLPTPQNLVLHLQGPTIGIFPEFPRSGRPQRSMALHKNNTGDCRLYPSLQNMVEFDKTTTERSTDYTGDVSWIEPPPLATPLELNNNGNRSPPTPTPSPTPSPSPSFTLPAALSPPTIEGVAVS